MTVPEYPSELPRPMSFRLTAEDQVLSDDGNGPKDFRRISQVPGATADVTFRFLLDQYKIFKQWVNVDLLRGLRWFWIQLPSAGGITGHIIRFVDPPNASLRGHRYWEVSARIEIRERAFSDVLPPSWEDVVLLLHMDGEVGSNTIVDSSMYNHAVTVVGNGQITNSFARFGQAFAHEDVGIGVVQYFDVSLGGEGLMPGDFTFEFWIRQTNAGVLMYAGTAGYLYNNAYQSYGGSSLGISTSFSSLEPVKHFVIQRYGSQLAVGREGALANQTSFTGSMNFSAIRFGSYPPNNNLFSNSICDEVKMTRKRAVYPTLHTSGTYTVPTRPTQEPVGLF